MHIRASANNMGIGRKQVPQFLNGLFGTMLTPVRECTVRNAQQKDDKSQGQIPLPETYYGRENH
jgi:hypothetical protein